MIPKCARFLRGRAHGCSLPMLLLLLSMGIGTTGGEIAELAGAKGARELCVPGFCLGTTRSHLAPHALHTHKCNVVLPRLPPQACRNVSPCGLACRQSVLLTG